jgi:heptosyltransferase-2
MSDLPILIVPYMWIGDFVRGHTVVKLLRQRHPACAIDILTTPTVAPLIDYMPGVRKGIPADLPRRRLAFTQHAELAKRLAAQGYGRALVLPRTWKSALAPYLAGIPVRTGFVGEARFALINDLRFGERRLPRMIDRCATLALARNERKPTAWPMPELIVPAAEIASWRERLRLAANARPVIAFAPGAVGPAKRWPAAYFAQLAKCLVAEGNSVWILGSEQEKKLAVDIRDGDGGHIHDLTGPDLRDAILALAAAQAVVSNDSGLLHVAAALGKPSVGIFGPTSPWHWAPLNPLAAILETTKELACRPCHKPVCRIGHHRCMHDITPEQAAIASRRAMEMMALETQTPQSILARLSGDMKN